MYRLLQIFFAVLTLGLIALGAIHKSATAPASTPEGAVQSMLGNAKSRDWKDAFTYVDPSSNIDLQAFTRDLAGHNGSLRTYSQIDDINTRVLNQTDEEATVRTQLRYSTGVGAFFDTRDLKVVRNSGVWKVIWPIEKEPSVPPQVIPVNYLRWDIVRRGAGDDWGAQNVEDPNCRILSMNAVESNGMLTIMGEVENEDTVPAFIGVGAVLTDKNGRDIAQESSFDKVSHVLLPKEVSPYRIDFPGVRKSDVQSVRMTHNWMLVPASADPVIGVLHQRIEKDSTGRTVLRGELVNQSGQTINIPHVLATFYDNAGKVIWVSDGYVDSALDPKTPEPFAVNVSDSVAANTHSFRVTANQYSVNWQE